MLHYTCMLKPTCGQLTTCGSTMTMTQGLGLILPAPMFSVPTASSLEKLFFTNHVSLEFISDDFLEYTVDTAQVFFTAEFHSFRRDYYLQYADLLQLLRTQVAKFACREIPFLHQCSTSTSTFPCALNRQRRISLLPSTTLHFTMNCKYLILTSCHTL